MPGLKTVFQAFFDAVLGLVIVGTVTFAVLCLYLNISERVTQRAAFLFGYKPVYIETGSMEPLVSAGSVVIVKEASYGEIKEGDVIMFKTQSGYVLHRFIGIDETALENGDDAFMITKGDANNVEDPTRLDPKNIIGELVIF